MDAKNILHADWLDILFDGRNKMYGAYNLRKYYSQKVNLAMFITFFLVALIVVSLKFSGINKGHGLSIPEIADPEWFSMPPKPVPPIPPKPVTQSSATSGNRQRYNKPIIVNSNTAPAEKIVALTDNTAIASSTHVSEMKFQVREPVDIPLIARFFSEDPTAPSPQTEFRKVEESATFPGGLVAWKRYMEYSLDAEKPLLNGAPAGTYVVVVKFIVGKNGSIREVVAETDHGYRMEEEAIRVIRRGPRWLPALQNNQHVDAWHQQAVTFVVPDAL